jgi:hypothetical protein
MVEGVLMRDAARNAKSNGARSRPVFLGSLLSVLDATGDLPPAFQDLLRRFDQAKGHFDSGDLSAERYASLLSSLRCFDAEGQPSTIGATSGLWYRMISDVWVQSPPPYQSASAISSAASLYRDAAAASAGYAGGGDDVVPDTGDAGAVDAGAVAVEAVDPAAGAGSVSHDGPASPAGGEDELLFGLPVQLFVTEPVEQGPVPHGSLPSLTVDETPAPMPRRLDGDGPVAGV